MALETKLVQKLSQSLLMTPQLQQAIKLLQLGRLDYIEAIQAELLENPVLEEFPEEDNKSGSEAPQEGKGEETASSEMKAEEISSLDKDQSPVDWERYVEEYGERAGSTQQKGTFDFSDRPSLEATLTQGPTLTEHILSQLRLADIDDLDRLLLLNIIGNLDKNGYLCCPIEELADICQCCVEDVNRALAIVKTLDPPGIGAKDLQDCLLIQLDTMGLDNSLAFKIVRDHLDKLERQKLDDIAKAEHTELEKVFEAVTVIRSLEPRPGRPFADDSARYIIPDIYVAKVNGEWVISLNEDGMPRLRVSPYYLKVLQSENGSTEHKAYLNDRLKAASWLIKSIHQRQQTIYKVTESIVKFQEEFFENGIAHLKPMVLKQVADDIGMHESTVSRVTSNKFVHTPQGVFELKFFFTSGIKTSGGEVSSSSVKERIKALIGDEDPLKPISDQKIVECLKSEGVTIARRTVAKYRESLGILSSSRRKKLF